MRMVRTCARADVQSMHEHDACPTPCYGSERLGSQVATCTRGVISLDVHTMPGADGPYIIFFLECWGCLVPSAPFCLRHSLPVADYPKITVRASPRVP